MLIDINLAIKVADAQSSGDSYSEWRINAENNRKDLYSLNLWGVPSFSIVDNNSNQSKSLLSVWGQDRLFAIENFYRNQLDMKNHSILKSNL